MAEQQQEQQDQTEAAAEQTPEAVSYSGRRNGLYPKDISVELDALMKTGWADTEQHDLEPVEQAAYAAKRRDALSARFPNERLVIPAGTLKTRSNDTEYAFRPSTGYVYLTGDQSEQGVLILEPTDTGHEAALYLIPRSSRENGEFWLDGNGELWTGRRNSLSEAEKLYGIPCRDVRKIVEEINAGKPAHTRIYRGHAPALDAALATDEHHDDELRSVLDELRLVKDEWEVGELQKAVDSTVRGFEDVVRSLDQAKATSERYIEGVFFLRARVEGNDVGYGTIAASGPHACTLHWVRNDGPVNDGDLLLMDAGVETTSLYTADVTRTLPVSGRFTDVQRKVYDLVWKAQQAGFAAVRPGNAYADFHKAAQRVLAEGLVEWGILAGPVDDVLEKGLQRRYTLHGTGHMLGLDVHDCAQARTETYVKGDLEPGMVLTVEPGLYFQPDDLTVPEEYRGVGVRIEDDVLVTADGNRVMSDGLPTTSEAVEAWMAALKK